MLNNFNNLYNLILEQEQKYTITSFDTNKIYDIVNALAIDGLTDEMKDAIVETWYSIWCAENKRNQFSYLDLYNEFTNDWNNAVHRYGKDENIDEVKIDENPNLNKFEKFVIKLEYIVGLDVKKFNEEFKK